MISSQSGSPASYNGRLQENPEFRLAARPRDALADLLAKLDLVALGNAPWMAFAQRDKPMIDPGPKPYALGERHGLGQGDRAQRADPFLAHRPALAMIGDKVDEQAITLAFEAKMHAPAPHVSRAAVKQPPVIRQYSVDMVSTFQRWLYVNTRKNKIMLAMA
jgi:hypothetical protein